MQAAGRRLPRTGGVLGVEPDLDGVAVELGVDGLGGKWQTLGHEQLQADEVESRHQLRDGVLDLQAGVHLEKGEAAVGQEEEFDGAGADVADGPGRRHRRGAHLRSQGRRHGGGGALLDDLLVTSLDRALTLEQMDHGAVGVPQDLDLDVAGTGDVGLEEDGAVAEGGRRLPGGRGDGVGQVVGSLDHPHAAAAASGRRLDQDGPAQFGGRVDQAAVGPVPVPRPGRDPHGGQHGDPGARHGGLGRQLRPHGLDDVGGRSDEDEAGLPARPGEGGVLGEEAVSGVDGVGAARARRRHQGVDAEIGLGRGGPGQTDDLVGLGHVGGAGIGIGADRHAVDAHGMGAAHDATGDLAPVGHQELRDHRPSPGTRHGSVTSGTRRSRVSRGPGCCR